ncbi:YIP1 family protein [bacterium]|nr:YIP1 family protein [bacterium]
MPKKLKINPWISIWTKPRETIKEIVRFNPNYRLLFLSTIVGFFSLLGIAQQWNLGEKLSFFSIIISVIILAPLFGYITFSISSWFVFFTGKLLKGQARCKEIRAAIAWSNVPLIVSCLLWILFLGVYSALAFKMPIKKLELDIFIFFALLVQLVISIWIIVIYVNALAEVQKFSILSAIFNIILSSILVFIVSILVGLISKWACSAFFDEPVLVYSLFT